MIVATIEGHKEQSRGIGNWIYVTEQSSAPRATLRLIPGAGVTPAEGSVKPTAGFTLN